MEEWFSIAQLLKFNLDGLPRTARGLGLHIKTKNWKSRTVPGQGGKGGVRIEVVPPAKYLNLINAKKYIVEQVQKKYPPSPIRNLKREPHNLSSPAPMEGFILVPRYDVTGSMGNGHSVHGEHVVDMLAFRAEWVRTELGTSPDNLILISAIGDSMEPTLRAHDLLLIDRGVTSITQDAIYAFSVDGELRVKRMQRLIDGGIVIRSDNQNYPSETLVSDQVNLVNIVGRVVWSGRRM